MKALSVRAPWWWWILYGGKTVENRSRRTHYRGPVLIHASKWWNMEDVGLDHESAQAMAKEAGYPNRVPPGMTFREMRGLGGHIVGVADIVDCRPPPADFPIKPGQVWNLPVNAWHMPGQWGWVLDNVRPVRNPWPVKGALGFFESGLEIEIDLLRRAT